MNDVETASAVPDSPVRATITARRHVIVQDKPPAFGGTDKGPMASELLLAGLLACQLSTFAKVAVKRHSDAQVTRLDGALHFHDGDIHHVTLTFHVTGGDDKEVATLVRLTDKACTISKALSVPIEATVARD